MVFLLILTIIINDKVENTFPLCKMKGKNEAFALGDTAVKWLLFKEGHKLRQ